MAISILHRITGVALAVGAVLMVVILVALALGQESYETVRTLLASTIGKAFLFLWAIALFLHLFNGIRHLVWDAGYGFEKSTTKNSGILVLLATVVITIVVWAVAFLTSNV